MAGKCVLRALRERGPLSRKDCRAVLANARTRMSNQVARRCVRVGNVIWLRTEHEFVTSLPCKLYDMPRAHRVFLREQHRRLHVKILPDKTVVHCGRFNATTAAALCRALQQAPTGADVSELLAEYPGARSDILRLCTDGKLVNIGNRVWATNGVVRVPGALQCWLETPAPS